ncbi:molybdopterin oxidoreductase family protein [Deinococcus radiophilus]|uniref:Molybdopterin oxidoreductase family protein n=1 Tax=Deinococcus radiophilus TaxID=32062 RepID=A0A3S0JMP0_9DEIO|nr:molybdopterin oxidoreductase family protein [Deinococcus radiophilus]RTR25222.1 molybdopterin oxidoreductase family protein [Deinococcus radiophilus]UFA50250.1 molybdopterin oxidoreductase family protein [Deinococcus radiophilus]
MTRTALLTCPLDCPDACRLKVTFAPDEQGRERLTAVTGDPQHPYTRGFACAKTVHYPSRQNHPDRPLTPLRRMNPKTDPVPQWEAASWDEALDAIAERLQMIIEERGAQAILPYHYAGTMGLMEGTHVHTLWRALGAAEIEETICASAGSAAWALGYGPRLVPDPLDIPHARLIVLWGINSLSTNSHLTPQITAARKNGARVVCVDPYRNRTAAFADTHYKLRPGSDAALVLGIMHQLFVNGWTDDAYIAELTEGVAELRAEAEGWDAGRTAGATGLTEGEVLELARLIGTTRPTYIRLGYGMTRHEFGGTGLRAVSLLPALTGDWRHRGGGAALSSGGAFALNRTRLGGAHLLREDVPLVNMNCLADALDPAAGFGATVIYNCNPATVAPDSDRVRAGLAREDLLVVVLEQAMTETAALADWVLPAATFVEHEDVFTSYGHHWLGYNRAELEPLGEAKPNTWIMQELGRRLGVTAPELYWTVDDLLADLLDTGHPHLAGITPERLKEAGTLRLSLPEEWRPYAHEVPTPSGRVQLTPVPRQQEAQAALTPDFPLRLLTPPAHHFLNSTYGLLERLNRAEGAEPSVMVHPQDAQAYALQGGSYVRLISEQGEVQRRVQVTDAAQPGVAVAEGIWWGTQAPDGKSINSLTAQTLTDLGGGSTFHNTRIRIEPLGTDLSVDGKELHL